MNKLEMQNRISVLINDAIRFGCAIGSWSRSNVEVHRFAANESVEAVAKVFTNEVFDIMEKGSLDEN